MLNYKNLKRLISMILVFTMFLNMGLQISIVNREGNIALDISMKARKIVQAEEITDTWTYGTPGPYGVYGHTLVDIDDNLYYYGGLNTLEHCYSGDFYEYNTISQQWTYKTAIETRFYASTVAIGSRIYIYGGTKNGVPCQLLIYEPSTNSTITSTATTMPYPRSLHAAAVVNNKMYIFGGENSGCDLSDTWEYDSVLDKWVRKSDMPFPYRGGMVVGVGDIIYFYGGTYGSVYSKTLWAYNTVNDTWTVVSYGPEGRYSGSIEAIGDKLYLYGGINSSVTPHNTLYEFDIKSNIWTEMAVCPTGRYLHATAVIGNHMYVYGGLGTYAANELFIYNNNSIPEISVNTPNPNYVYSALEGYNLINISGTVKDFDIGDKLKVYYRIDGTDEQLGTQLGTDIIADSSNQAFSGVVDVSLLSEGNHTLNISVTDNKEDKPTKVSIPFKVDNSVPIIETFLSTSTASSITVSGSATDAIAGLDAFPYKYTIGTNEPTAWITNTSYTQDGLMPNTQYNVTFEAKDAVGNIDTTTSSVYTKAVSPSLNINSITPYSCNINISDNNPTNNQYQISINDGAQYITPEGTLTTSPVWITLPSKNITVTGLSPSTTYTFTAKAKNDEGIETAWSAPISGTTLVQPPNAPVNTTAVATSSSISVVWDPVASSTGYDIEVDGTIIDNGTYTSYTHTGLTPYTQHAYRVRAKNEGGTGAWSELMSKYTQQDTPNTPFNIDAAATNTSIIVTWQPISGATAYDIEVDGEVVNNSSSTNYVHTGLLSGTMHGYRVRSINSGGKSDWSNEVLVSTLTDTPIVPSNVSATPGSGQITVAWDAIPGATYEIEVDGNIKDNGTSNTFIHSNIEAGISHSYRVRTNKSGSLSDWSTIVTATIPIEEFGTPKNINAEATDTTVTISWSPVVDATGYEVEVDGVVLDNGIETACVFNSLTSNTQYTYRVRAKGIDKVSDWSEPIAVTTFAFPTPSNIISSATETSISLTWDVTAGATSYEVDIDGQLVEVTTNSYTQESLTPNTQHSYRIRAKSTSGTSNWSSIINEATLSNSLNTPTGIIVKSMTNSIQLVWKPVPEVDSYEVEIDGTTVENVTTTTYIHSGLTADTQHSYRVKAIKNTVPGNWSNSVIAFTLSDAPLTPTNIEVSSTMSSILITWDEAVNATEYEIEVDGVIINAGLNTRYLHNNLAPESTHTYRVRAKSSVAQSPWSEAITTNTKSSVHSYALQASNGQVFNLMFTANEITDPTNYTYTITYNPNELEMVDLCALTSRLDQNTGNLIGTDIQIVQFSQGTIVFKKLGNSTGQAWTGLVNSIKFKGKIDGEAQIIYSIQ